MWMQNKIITFFVLVMIQSPCFAADYSGVLRGNRGIVWQNAVYNHSIDALVPTVWSLAHERTTTEWYPGTFLNASSQLVTFRNFSGDEFNATVEFKGMEYNLGSSQNSFNEIDVSKENPSLGLYSLCPTTNITAHSSFVSHRNDGCIGDNGFISDVRIEPFKFYRPGINLPDIEDKIQDLPSGRYVATLFSTPFYLYKSQSDVLSQTQLSEPIIISIDYVAAELESVTIVSGDGVIEPRYDKLNKSVSGETYYEVELRGNLPAGAIMKFVDFENNFYMASQIDNNQQLPYSFTCVQGCSDNKTQDIILNGKFNRSQFPSGEVLVSSEGSNINSILTKYRIYYDAQENDVITSSYMGSINIIYEVNI